MSKIFQNLKERDEQEEFNFENMVFLFAKNFLNNSIKKILSNLNQKSSLLKRVSNQRSSVNSIVLSEFESNFDEIKNSIKKPLKQESNKNDIDDNKYYQKNIADCVSSDNQNNSQNENQSNKFTKEFLTNKFRKTVNILSLESEKTEKKNINNKCNLYSKDFFNKKIRKTISCIEEHSDKNSNNNENNCNQFSKLFLKDTFRNTITKIDKDISNSFNINDSKFNNDLQINRKKSIITPTGGFIKESLRRLSSKIDEKVELRIKEEKKRKTEILEKNIITENKELETEIERGKINYLSKNFWRKSYNETLEKYNQDQKILINSVIKIQKNFRRSLWKFIIKLELMNLQIQKDNEKAIEKRKKRKSVHLIAN